MNLCRSLIILLLAGFTSVALAQSCTNTDTNGCAVIETNIIYPAPASTLMYPLASDQYSVQYRLGNGNWTNAPVWISYYGQTTSSPSNVSSGYVPGTSMSFVSIPAAANTNVQLLVTKLSSGFLPMDNVTVRPRAKHVGVTLMTNGTVNLSTTTAPNFAGDQFLLWWGDDTAGGTIASLVFFLDPPYAPPTGKVKTITSYTDLTNLNQYDTLAFQGKVVLGGTGTLAYEINTNITNIYLAPGAWVQGKLRFKYSGGIVKQVYGPGVLDGSLFCYALRHCDDDQGYHVLSFANPPSPDSPPDTLYLNGIIMSDHNHAAADLLINGAINNVKSIGWNGLNGGFRLGDNTTVSNVFLRSGDDSLMVWGSNVLVTNATIWQNYNGAAVNLGWGDGSPGDGCLIDGLYVVKTDWAFPTHPSFTKTNLNFQNDAVITSLMVPGTVFGSNRPPLFRNILVEDPPNVLLSLKILFPECNDPDGPRLGGCSPVDLTLPSVLNLNIENLCTPVSTVSNLIGFLTLPSGFTYEFPKGTTNTFTNGTFSGSMNIGLTNVILQLPDGSITPLTSANAAGTGMIATSGTNVQINYGFAPSECLLCLPQLSIVSAGANTILSWPTNFPSFSLEAATNLASPIVWKTNLPPPVIINGMSVVTNPISSTRQFYRLGQ